MEEPVVEETGVPLAALRVEDPKLRPASRRTEPVARDRHLRPLPDDVPPEADPRPPGQLEAQPGRRGDGPGDGRRGVGRLQDDEEGLGPAGQGDEPVETVLERAAPDARVRPRREVDHEEVHRARREERAGEREAVRHGRRRQDDEPLRADAAGDGLDRVECAGEIEPGDDRTRDLGLRGEPERERGPTARGIAAEGHARRARQPAGPEDGVERGEPGRDDLVARQVRRSRERDRRRGRERGLARGRHRVRGPLAGERHGRERPDGGPVAVVSRSQALPEAARRGRSPARLEGRDRGRDVRGEGAHRPRIIERMFDIGKGRMRPRRPE